MNHCKIENYKEKIKLLDSENRLIFKRIDRLKRKINRINMKKKKIRDKLLILCEHHWIPNIVEYNVYDRPKYCKICGIDK
jgi:hypothetical protein